MVIKSFEDFRASRVACPDLETALRADFCRAAPGPIAGLLYGGELYIEGDAAGGYCLTLENYSAIFTADTLLEAEARLYAYGVAAGYFPGADDGDAHALVVEFVDWLACAVGPENFAEIKRRNAAEADKSICHSHDFCDANEGMILALSHGLGRLDQEPDFDLVNRAWNIARAIFIN